MGAEDATHRTTERTTFTYKHVGEHPVLFDLYPPVIARSSTVTKTPIVIYWHGGGCNVGSRTSWFPAWLQQRLANIGVAFISADYQLMPPATGAIILEDIQDIFVYISQKLNAELRDQSSLFEIDLDRIGVAGTSAGALVAALAVKHAKPTPKCFLSCYGPFMSVFTYQSLVPKTKPHWGGRPLLNPKDYEEYLYPKCLDLPIATASELIYAGPDAPIPGYPANPRMMLGRLFMQLGVTVDYWTGRHGLADVLREHPVDLPSGIDTANALRKHIPPELHHLFPLLFVDKDWPPTYQLHGECDSAITLREPINLRDVLRTHGVHMEIDVVPGKEHSFDYAKNAEEELHEHFDKALQFIQKNL